MRLSADLLRRAAKAAQAHSRLSAQITDAFRERYGCTFSDVDCDELIEILDYHGGQDLTVDDCDRAMALCGASPIKDTPDA